MQLIILPAARRDLADIWEYTAETWGTAQADAYVTQLSDVFARLLDGTIVSQTADDIRRGVRRVPVGKHMVFFRVVGETTEVLRVLHQRMDVGAL
ncbi:type II toxin-antitoxin system RelE/ParE family toxin [Cognatiyoonia sp. IB215182]|uniref:type II toxin-antitoxin system RelE/ParE family toxin n=1 Tax=Cognatiyoonia sp. IB215182 TaxID=3097353 RepID=UPI002A0C2A65|nr:type II toxin-antitoxin system RelE/ParE family toxin [Cognatiyoonia sp. IB215182]MDX8354676.1 type II toxin-antitoxin system RelE/ParE family toxin [Cognatiyoonia sp. IB215182]